MEPVYVVAFSVMFTLLFFMVGSIIGWLTYRHALESRPPYLHPEFFDENGNVIADEVVSLRIESGFIEEFQEDYRGLFDEDDDDDDDDEEDWLIDR